MVHRLAARQQRAVFFAALVALFAITLAGRLASRGDAPPAAAGGVLCQSDAVSSNSSITVQPAAGAVGSLFDVDVKNVTPNGQGTQRFIEIIMDPGTQPILLNSGFVPGGQFGYTATDVQVPQHDDGPGVYTVRACWNNDDRWQFTDTTFEITADAPTPTPTTSPTATPTASPTVTASPTPSGPKLVYDGVPIMPPPVFDAGPITLPSDLSIENVEITQSVQCLDTSEGDTTCPDNSLPLVAKRTTWVRVYVKSGGLGFAIPNVPVRLQVWRNGAVYLDMTTTTTAHGNPDRNELSHSANFLVLCNVCANNNELSFVATVDPNNAFAEGNELNNRFPSSGFLSRTVHARNGFHIVALPMRYNPSGPTDQTVPDSTLNGLAKYLTMAYPVPHYGSEYVEYEIGSTYLWTDSTFTSGEVKTAINNAYVTGGSTDPPDQVTVWVPGATGFFNGTSDPLWNGGQGVATVVDTSYAPPNARGRVLSHEIAHNFGRRHPCTSNAQSDPSWPYTGPGVAGLDYKVQETGMRTVAEVVWVFIFPIPIITPDVRPDDLVDMMQGGHCGFPGASSEPNSNDLRWVSPYTYQQLYCTLSPSNATASNCRNGNAVALGTIARVAPAGASGMLLVSGSVEPGGTGQVSTVYSMPAGEASPEIDGAYCVELRQGAIVLDSRCFEQDFENQDAQASESQNFSIVIPAQTAADTIALAHSGDLDIVAVSDSAPTVEVTQPSTGGLKSGSLQVEWEANDADGEPLLFTVQYSPDGGATFTPVMADISETSVTADLSGLPGGDDAFFRVLATDNTGHTTTADSAHFTVANKPPVAEILSPDDGSAHQLGNPIMLIATASDLEDPPLPPEAFEWTSDVDGELGVGNAGFAVDLTPGLHTLTLTATDSDGATGTDTVQVFIGIPAYVNVMPDIVPVGGGSDLTAHLELPNTYDVSDINLDSLLVWIGDESFSPADVTVGDFDQDGLPDLLLELPQDVADALPGPPGPVRIMVSGATTDELPFMGADLLGLAPGGDINCSGELDGADVLATLRWRALLPAETNCLAYADTTCNGGIDARDGVASLRVIAGIDGPAEYCPLILVANIPMTLPQPARKSSSRDWWGVSPYFGATLFLPALVIPWRRRRRP